MDNDNLIGYDQNQELLTFNTIDQKLLPLKLETAHSSRKINDLFAYGRYLYSLDSLNNQIYKYTKTIDGFGKEEPWIQGNPNISNALAFAIDGSIYVFKKTGQISKFYKNAPAEFNLADIEPALSVQDPNILDYQNKIKLFTDSDKRYLYLLDGASQRLIILSKEGKLVKQLMFPQLKDLKDFVISQREDRAWLLDGTSIFEINLK
ncbi:hypothetical protein IID20_04865 [Patescibacteria group bacterium]|nr:hypothetical protein [Patescibacteria group bacterium]